MKTPTETTPVTARQILAAALVGTSMVLGSVLSIIAAFNEHSDYRVLGFSFIAVSGLTVGIMLVRAAYLEIIERR